MLDGSARRIIDPWLLRIAASLARMGATPDAVTLAAFMIGVAAAVAIALHAWWAGLVLILLSRLCDGLDGAVARQTRTSDFGGFLDIVLDFAFYGMIPFAFILADPAANGLAGSFLILSFYVNGASFLAYSVMAQKRGLETDARGVKSIYFTTGLAEATETITVFALACLFPNWFAPLAWLFAGVCFYTALSRIVQARSLFRS